MQNEPTFTDKMLLQLPRDSRDRAYAPYSGYTVGAACLGGSGIAYFGCNIENASYPVGICAERAAAASAIAHGETKIVSLALAAGPKDSPPLADARPCGMCLQFISEFMNSNARILISDGDNGFIEFTLENMLPQAFKLLK